MDELQYLATWVKEQHAQEYLLTWLLNQPGLWWSEGEGYQAAMLKSGKLLREYVQKQQQGSLFQGIAEKITGDETWDAVAASLGRIIEVYQEELLRLQDRSRRQNMVKKNLVSPAGPLPPVPVNFVNPSLEVQQALPDPYGDALTGDDIVSSGSSMIDRSLRAQG